MKKEFYAFAKKLSALLLIVFLMQGITLAQEPIDAAIAGESWASVKANKEGRLILLYYKNRPFNYLDDYARQTGIDYEMVNLFINFAKKKYDVTIEPVWIELADYEELASSFPNVKNGAIGLPATSATPDMGKMALLSRPYMHNKLVVVTHPSIQKAASEASLKAALKEATAFYVANSAAATALQTLNSAQQIISVANSEILADKLASTENSYAIMPLYDYFVATKRGLDLNRQPFFEQPQTDVAWWLPKNSDWAEPMVDFFTHTNFEANAAFLVKRHCTIDAEELTLQEAGKSEDEQASGEEQSTGMFAFKGTNSHFWFGLIAVTIVIILIIANRSIAASRKKAAEELAARRKAMK